MVGTWGTLGTFPLLVGWVPLVGLGPDAFTPLCNTGLKDQKMSYSPITIALVQNHTPGVHYTSRFSQKILQIFTLTDNHFFSQTVKYL